MRVMFTGAAVLAAIVCVGCGAQALQPGTSDGHETVLRGSDFSGEDLFLGIMFGQGEVAEALPTMWGGCDTARFEALSDADPGAISDGLKSRIALAEELGEEHVAALLGQAAEDIHDIEYLMPADGSTAADDLMSAIGEADREFFERFGEQVTSGDHEAVRLALSDAREAIAEQTLEAYVDVGQGVGLAVVYETAVVVYKNVFIYTDMPWDDSLMYDELVINEIANAF